MNLAIICLLTPEALISVKTLNLYSTVCLCKRLKLFIYSTELLECNPATTLGYSCCRSPWRSSCGGQAL